jgi:uncharacterized membrane protein
VASDINNAGQIVGHFGDALGTHGFLDIDGNFTTLDAPGGGSFTDAIGINDAGEIVGDFGVVGTGPHHGFVARPTSAVPEPSGLAILGVGLIGIGILRRRNRA